MADPTTETTTPSAAKYQPGDWVVPTVPTTFQFFIARVMTPLAGDTEPVYVVSRTFSESELRLIEGAK